MTCLIIRAQSSNISRSGSAHQRGSQGASAGWHVKNSMGSNQSFDRSPLHPHYQEKVGGMGSASTAWNGKSSYDTSHGKPGRSTMKPAKGDETASLCMYLDFDAVQHDKTTKLLGLCPYGFRP
nr:hypothetical protein [Tanacetum cinerariifolium]